MKTHAEAIAYLWVHGQAIGEAAVAGDEKAQQIVGLYMLVWANPEAAAVGLLLEVLNDWQQRVQVEGQG